MQFSSTQKRVEARYLLLSFILPLLSFLFFWPSCGSSNCTDSNLASVGIEDNCKNLPYFPFRSKLLWSKESLLTCCFTWEFFLKKNFKGLKFKALTLQKEKEKEKMLYCIRN